MDDLIKCYCDVIDEHRNWIKPFNNQYFENWENLLNNCDEAAICEAKTRQLLSKNNVLVTPYEDLSKGGPDFMCEKNNKRFYVEVTCITIKKMSKQTGSLHNKEGPKHIVHSITEILRSEITQKVQQCCNLSAPRIIAIGTLHSQGHFYLTSDIAAQELLTGEQFISMKYDSEKGAAISKPRSTSVLKGSFGIRQDKKSPKNIEEARKSISAVLLCDYYSTSIQAVGVLHQNPLYEFDRSLLPEIKFCKLTEFGNNQLKTEWI